MTNLKQINGLIAALAAKLSNAEFAIEKAALLTAIGAVDTKATTALGQIASHEFGTPVLTGTSLSIPYTDFDGTAREVLCNLAALGVEATMSVTFDPTTYSFTIAEESGDSKVVSLQTILNQYTTDTLTPLFGNKIDKSSIVVSATGLATSALEASETKVVSEKAFLEAREADNNLLAKYTDGVKNKVDLASSVATADQNKYISEHAYVEDKEAIATANALAVATAKTISDTAIATAKAASDAAILATATTNAAKVFSGGLVRVELTVIGTTSDGDVFASIDATAPESIGVASVVVGHLNYGVGITALDEAYITASASDTTPYTGTVFAGKVARWKMSVAGFNLASGDRAYLLYDKVVSFGV